MDERPKLLFVSPVFPDVTGYGLAMRAGAMLEALATFFQVHLLVVPVQDPRRPALAPRVQPWCREYRVVPIPWLLRLMIRSSGYLGKRNEPYEWRLATARTVHQAALAFQGVRFDFVHVFRLYMTPFAVPYMQHQHGPIVRWLDLDDIESITRRRLAALYRLNGLPAEAQREQTAAHIYARLERELLTAYDMISVCSPPDKALLKAELPARNILVLPNVVRPPAAPEPPRPDSGAFNFLFVGNLAYYPNEEAVAYFIRDVLPLIRVRTRRALRLTIVGAGARRILRGYRDNPDVEIAGFAKDVAPYYSAAGAVIAPLRAGGGTRIKLLEAFAFARPVVSTSMGAEGLAVSNEEHLLIGDDADALARQCCRLVESPALGRALAVRAVALVLDKYTPDVLRSTLRSQLGLD